MMFQKLRSYILIAWADLRFQGASVLAWRVIVKLCSPLVKLDLQILFDIDLTAPVQARNAKLAVVVERADISAIDEILDMQMRRLSAEEISRLDDQDEVLHAQMLRVRAGAFDSYRRAMLAGEQCYLARTADGEIVHSNWIRFHDCGPMDGRPVELRPGQVYTTDAYTAESMRGLGVHEQVLRHMLRVAQQRDCQRAFTITDFTKAGSRRGVKRGGWRRRGSILYVTPRGLRRTYLVKLGGDLEPLFEHARVSMSSDG